MGKGKEKKGKEERKRRVWPPSAHPHKGMRKREKKKEEGKRGGAERNICSSSPGVRCSKERDVLGPTKKKKRGKGEDGSLIQDS